MLDNHFTEFRAAQNEYHKAVPNIKKRRVVAAFNKINKYALMSIYSDIEPNLNPKESLLSYRLCQIKTEIENLAKDVSDNPVKIENTVNPSICDDATINKLTDALSNRNKKDLEKIILNRELPIESFSTGISELIEEYRVFHDMWILLNEAKFADTEELDQSLEAYQSFKAKLIQLNGCEAAARLAASSKGIINRYLR